MSGDGEPGFFLAHSTVAILGLGLMGGSLALALRGQAGALIGIDPDPATLELAAQWKLADHLSEEPGNWLAQADLVVLAAPLRAIFTLLDELPALHPGAPVVLDLGSTKVEVVQRMARLPARFDPIGGHPMCGKERSSLVEAEAGLYTGARFALVPLERTTPRARAAASALALAVGARPLWLDAHTHDRWVAATSHMPTLLACALAACTPLEAAPLAGPGFRSTTRLAAQPSGWMLDILATNRANVLDALREVREQVTLLEQRLESADYPALQQLLEQGAASRERILAVSPGETR